MTETISAVLLVGGTVLMFLSSLGVLRMPDLFMRLSASTKATTLGVATTLAAAGLFLQDVGAGSRAAAAVLFVLLTAPVSGHMIARAAYNAGVPLWKGTLIDELRGRYHRERHCLDSHSPGPTAVQQQNRNDAERRTT